MTGTAVATAVVGVGVAVGIGVSGAVLGVVGVAVVVTVEVVVVVEVGVVVPGGGAVDGGGTVVDPVPALFTSLPLHPAPTTSATSSTARPWPDGPRRQVDRQNIGDVSTQHLLWETTVPE
ncbi:MAG TPA: hypothetical protein VNQ73_16180 [Ilumatobacter sp.]|nr:hypothetical protein [Ilumatobacter sp.]